MIDDDDGDRTRAVPWWFAAVVLVYVAVVLVGFGVVLYRALS